MENKKKHPLRFAVRVSFLTAVLLSVCIAFSANEVFALQKAERQVEVTVPDGASHGEIAKLLKKEGILHAPHLYMLYASLRSWDNAYLSGEFTLNRNMSYDELRYILKPKKGARIQKKVTIPEGYTTEDIVELFVSMGIGTKEGFYDCIESGGDFGYDFVNAIPQKEGRTARLDGYLFPDTYFVYADSTEKEILQKLLSNFNQKFDESMREEAFSRGYTVDDIVTLASIIEKEAYNPSDMTGISSVFYNRLHNTNYPYLQSDATVAYAKHLAGENFTPADIDEVTSPYNTYKTRGLPPGPIASPGLLAIEAALRPDDTPYYYFLTGKNKSAIFSRTYAEHLGAIAKMRP